MKIAFFDLFKKEEESFRNLLEGHEVLFFEEKLSVENIEKIKDIEVLSVFVSSPVTKEIIDQLPNLKLISARSTGYDHIDSTYAESRGIKVATVPAYGSHTVAEFTFGLLLSLARKVYIGYSHLKDDTNFSLANLEGFDLMGKTLGIIGTGKIGKNVVKIAKGFGMNVLAFDLYPDMAFAEENGFTYSDLDQVLKESDIVTLHVPYTKENHHLINKENILKMKKGVYIINTARGELIDTSSLLWGLKEKIIAGAGLDVLEGERDMKEEHNTMSSVSLQEKVMDYRTLLENHMLIDMENVVVTPHIAFYSKEAEDEIVRITSQNIDSFSKGNPINLVKI